MVENIALAVGLVLAVGSLVFAFVKKKFIYGFEQGTEEMQVIAKATPGCRARGRSFCIALCLRRSEIIERSVRFLRCDFRGFIVELRGRSRCAREIMQRYSPALQV